MPSMLPAARPPIGPAPGLLYAGFWLRVVAALLDGVCSFALIFALVLIATPFQDANGTAAAVGGAVLAIVGIAAWLALQIVVPGRFGGTIGMRVLGMWIVREQDGSQIGYGLAAGRLGVYMAISFFSLGIGAAADALLVAFDGRNQSIHDKACSTLVIRRG
ncbi:MAG TPA: RDD family protein [Candidatus Dormibacteraeota bacterium]|nr:RDD family protein [Candidatus Dormibacteraeota bacterium]